MLLLLAIFFNSQIVLSSQSSKELSSIPQVKELVESSVDSESSAFCCDVFTMFGSPGVMGVCIAFSFLLCTLIILAFYFFVFKRRANRAACECVDANRVMANKMEGINLVFEMLPVGVVVFSSDGTLIEINKNALEIIGVLDEKLIKGLKIESIPSLAESIKDAFKKRESIHTNFFYDFSKIRKLNYSGTSISTGKQRLDFKGTPIFSSCGKFEKYIFIIEDITEMHEKEQLLSETRLNLSLALETGDVTVWGYSLSSDRYYNIYGNDPTGKASSFKDGLSLIHPDDKEEFVKNCEELFKGELLNKTMFFKSLNTVTNEYEHLRTDIKVVFSDDGTVDRIVGTRRNITSEIISKKKVDEVMSHLVLSTQSTGMRMWYIENKTLYLFEKDAFVKAKYKLSTILSFIHPEDREHYEEMYNAISVGDNCVCDKEVFRVYDKQTDDYNYLECSSKGIKNSDGNVYRIVGAYCDVTKRKIDEAKVDKLRKSLDVALVVSNIIVWIEDLKNIDADPIYYGAIRGFDIKEKKSWIDNIHPKDIEKCTKYLEDILSGAAENESILIYLKVEGGYGYFECALSLLCDENGEPQRLVGSLKDMSEINDLNETLNNLYNESQTLIESLPIGIEVYDKNMVLQYVNNSLAKTFGITDVEAHLKKGLNLLDNPALTPKYKEQFENGVDFDGDIEFDLQTISDSNTFQTKYTHKMYLEGKARAIKDSNGDVIKYILILYDISERRRTELELKDSEYNLKLALEAGDVYAWSYGVESKVFSYVGGRTFGSGAITLDGEHRLIHPNDISLRNDLMNDLIQGKRDEAQAVIRYKNNATEDKYSYYNTSLVAKKENGVVVAIAFAQKDITYDYLHEIERESSRKKIEFAIDNAELTLWEYDVDNKLFTSYGDSIIGLDLTDNLTVNNYRKYVNVDRHSEVKFRRIISLMNEGLDESYSIDVRISSKLKDFSEWMHCTVGGSSFEKNQDGRVIKYVGFIKDNTKWVTLNTLLDEKNRDLNFNNQLLQEVIEHMPGALFIKDINSDLKYYMANNVFCDRITQKPMHEVIGYYDYDFLPKDVAENFRNDDLKCIEANVQVEKDEAVIVDGKKYMWRTIKSPVTLVNNVKLLICMSIDVTEIYRMKDKAEQSDQLKSQFLANMSHELRTPLNAIVGFSNLLMTTEDEETKNEFNDIINTNSEMLLSLINDILDLSKMESGTVSFNEEFFSINELLDETYLSFNARIHPNVTLSCERLEEPLSIKLDSNRFNQVLNNFLSNAAKYTLSGEIVFGCKVENGGVKLFVKDTGIGISEENKNKIFGRFEKVDNFAQGTGLGLSICKALADLRGGKIGFDSTLGVGSYFWIWIPCEMKIE